MNGHSDECGYPFCDKMVISVQVKQAYAYTSMFACLLAWL
jgi:hypothetical protein